MFSAGCIVNSAHRTRRRRSRHSYYCVRFGGTARINFAFIRHTPDPRSVYAICGSSDGREPSAELAYGHSHQRA
jgi:hypothetical protein